MGPGHHSWAGQSLVFVGICCHLWAAIFVCEQSSLFFGQSWWQGVHGLSLALGIVSWLLLAVLLGCGHGWLKKEVMSQVVILMWCLNSHVRLHVQSHMIFSQFTVKTPQSCWAWARPTCQLLPLKTMRAWQELQGDNKDLENSNRGYQQTYWSLYIYIEPM